MLILLSDNACESVNLNITNRPENYDFIWPCMTFCYRSLNSSLRATSWVFEKLWFHLIPLKKIMVTFKSPTRLHLQKTYFDRMLFDRCPQNQINCYKNEIRILFRSRDIQVGRLKCDILYINFITFCKYKTSRSGIKDYKNKKLKEQYCASRNELETLI